MAAAQSPLLSAMAGSGHRVPIVGHRGHNKTAQQETDTPPENKSIAFTGNGTGTVVIDVTGAGGWNGPLIPGDCYELSMTLGVTTTSAANASMAVEWSNKGGTAPTPVATDWKWPIGTAPVWNFKCLAGQELLAVMIINAGNVGVDNYINIRRLS